MTHFRCERALDSLVLYDRGDAWLCCPEATTRPLGNVFETGLLELWRGPGAREIREEISAGRFSLCRRCPHLPAPLGPVQEVADDSVPVPDRIPMLSASFDRACNLSCPTCRTSTPPPRDDVALLYAYLLNSGILAEVDSLRLLGSGEPLASRPCLDFLARVPWERYPLLRIHLQTNGLLFTYDRYWSLHPATDRISEVSISVDAATRETYALNRSAAGSAYDALLDNLEFASELKRTRRIQELTLVFVVQANNFREMLPFVALARRLGARARFLKFYNWGTFTDKEYARRAVHLPGHPEHETFLAVASDPVFSTNPRVIKAWR